MYLLWMCINIFCPIVPAYLLCCNAYSWQWQRIQYFDFISWFRSTYSGFQILTVFLCVLGLLRYMLHTRAKRFCSNLTCLVSNQFGCDTAFSVCLALASLELCLFNIQWDVGQRWLFLFLQLIFWQLFTYKANWQQLRMVYKPLLEAVKLQKTHAQYNAWMWRAIDEYKQQKLKLKNLQLSYQTVTDLCTQSV